MKEGLLRMAVLLSSLSFNYLFERREQRMITAKDKKTKKKTTKNQKQLECSVREGPSLDLVVGQA